MLERPATSHTSQAPAGLGAIALAATLWALGAVVAASLFDDGVPPLELAEARSVVAALGLALIPASWRPPVDRPTPAVRRSLVILGICIGLVNVVYTAARLRRRPGNDVVVAVLLALAGVALVSGVVGADLGSVDALGVTMGLASAVLFASYTLIGESVTRTYGPLGAMFRAFAIAGSLWICWQVFNGFPRELFDLANLPRVLLIGLGATLAPFLLYLWGVERVKAERAAIAATLEPVLGAVVAWVLLDQSLGALQTVGGVLVIAAVILIQTGRSKPVLAPEL